MSSGGQDKPASPSSVGPDAAPVGSSDAALAETAALPAESPEKLVQVTHAQSFEFSVGRSPIPSSMASTRTS